MKKFWIIFLASIMFLIGYNCVYFYAFLRPFSWYHFLLLGGGVLICWPAIWWWIDYFKKTFNNND